MEMLAVPPPETLEVPPTEMLAIPPMVTLAIPPLEMLEIPATETLAVPPPGLNLAKEEDGEVLMGGIPALAAHRNCPLRSLARVFWNHTCTTRFLSPTSSEIQSSILRVGFESCTYQR